MRYVPSSHVKIGLVGKPNAGKSTLFSAICSSSAEIGQYPFTTIKPNVGASYITVKCPHTELGKECSPNFGRCESGIRFVPIEIIDIPGLVEGASSGKGMGNEFLENIKEAIAILQIYDASGRSALDGVIVDKKLVDPIEEVNLVIAELFKWVIGKLTDDWDRFAKRADLAGDTFDRALLKRVSSIGMNLGDLHRLESRVKFPEKFENWKEEDFQSFAEFYFSDLRRIIRVGNKVDLISEEERRELKERLEDTFLISAEFELTLSKAKSHGFISSTDPPFGILHNVSEKQKAGLDMISELFRSSYVTRTSDILTRVVLEDLERIVVYPVYDETHWTDKDGSVLPDAFIMKKGETAIDLAYKVHSDIGDNFIRAIDGRSKRVVGKDHVLNNGDILKIVSKTK